MRTGNFALGMLLFLFAEALQSQEMPAEANAPVPVSDGRHAHHAAAKGEPVPGWTTRYDGLRFPVSTKNVAAQKAMEQGLLLDYAFNHEAAVAAFQRAAQLDPTLAMAHWGQAKSLGSNINSPVTPERHAQAWQALQRALLLRSSASPREQAYIDALATRYRADANAPQRPLDLAYAAAMQALANAYPDDLNAATLYAESLMLLNPWKLWTTDGRSAPGTQSIIDVLENVQRRDPWHVGANHYYIHAVEASPNPERALTAAKNLEALKMDTGHLAHMPGHIYMRTGDYEGMVRSNIAAVEADDGFIGHHTPATRTYMGYFLHNLDFVIIGEAERGDSKGALKASARYHELALERANNYPSADHALNRHPSTLLRFGRWKDVLAMPPVKATFPVSRAFQAYARGVAHAALGDVPKARQSLAELDVAIDALQGKGTFRGNDADHMMLLARHLLEARIARAGRNATGEITSLKRALALQDAMQYDEPPSWEVPIRETLGGAYLRSNDPVTAETVFRDNLIRYPRHPRTLFGLREALKAQGRQEEAMLVDEQFQKAWAQADVKLSVEDL